MTAIPESASGGVTAAGHDVIPHTGRRWWIAGLWTLVSPPTAFLYVGLAGGAVAGYSLGVVWMVFCLFAEFNARLYGLVVAVGVLLVYSTIPVLAALARRRLYRKNRWNNRRWYLFSLALSLVAVVFVHLTQKKIIGLDSHTVRTTFMANTLLPGDYILIDTHAYGRVEPQPGDLVVFQAPRPPQRSLVMRVVGLPGDTLRITFKLLYINGKMIGAPATATFNDPERIFPEQLSPRDNYGPLVVPADHYFLLGDNRDEARDSRFWGPVPREMILGRAKMIYCSRKGLIARLERIGRHLK
jgi:signal peptidase I